MAEVSIKKKLNRFKKLLFTMENASKKTLLLLYLMNHNVKLLKIKQNRSNKDN